MEKRSLFEGKSVYKDPKGQNAAPLAPHGNVRRACGAEGGVGGGVRERQGRSIMGLSRSKHVHFCLSYSGGERGSYIAARRMGVRSTRAYLGS